MMRVVLWGLLASTLLPGRVWAHSPLSSSGDEQLAASLSLLLIMGGWLFYWLGCRRVPVRRHSYWLFNITLVATLFTVLGPLDSWAEHSSAAHMTQHMLMMAVIPPLLVLARPLPPLFAVAGPRMRRFLLACLTITRSPMACAWLHAFVIWFWHLPPFYMLALENPWWHIFEHACFLLTALWFWWAVLQSSAEKLPLALLALLFTLMHTGFLGAFLTFSSAPWYPGESRDLADQQLAGLIMWVMGGIPYIMGAAWAAQRWYRRLQGALE